MKKLFILLAVCAVLLCSWTMVSAHEAGDGQHDVAENAAAEENNEAAKDTKYEILFEDETFIYLLDKENTGWIRKPYDVRKYVIDAWVKMMPYELSTQQELLEPSEDRKYYLEHYLIDPETNKIQFLCEVEVTGRPENNITQRKYDPANWEGLVPESMEDRIFHAIVRKMGKKKGDGTIKQFSEVLEDVFRISI